MFGPRSSEASFRAAFVNDGETNDESPSGQSKPSLHERLDVDNRSSVLCDTLWEAVALAAAAPRSAVRLSGPPALTANTSSPLEQRQVRLQVLSRPEQSSSSSPPLFSPCMRARALEMSMCGITTSDPLSRQGVATLPIKGGGVFDVFCWGCRAGGGPRHGAGGAEAAANVTAAVMLLMP